MPHILAELQADGHWDGPDRFVVPIEAKDEPSRWVTRRALEALRAAASPAGIPYR